MSKEIEPAAESECSTIRLNKDSLLDYGSRTPIGSRRIEADSNLVPIINTVIEKLTHNKISELTNVIENSSLDRKILNYVIVSGVISSRERGFDLSKRMRACLHSLLVPVRFLDISDLTELTKLKEEKLKLEYIKSCLDGCLLQDYSSPTVHKYIENIIFIASEYIVKKDCVAHQLPWGQFIFYIHQFKGFYTSANDHHFYQVSLITPDTFTKFVEGIKTSVYKLLGSNSSNRNELLNKDVASDMNTTYWELKDIYTLDKIVRELKNAYNVTYYGLFRLLQLIGEYTKNTKDSPNVSEELKGLLLEFMPLGVIKKIRDDVCHIYSIPEYGKYSALADLMEKISCIFSELYVLLSSQQAVKIKQTLIEKDNYLHTPLPYGIRYELSTVPSSLATLDKETDKNESLLKNNVNRLFARFQHNNQLVAGNTDNILSLDENKFLQWKGKFLEQYKLNAEDNKLLEDLAADVKNLKPKKPKKQKPQGNSLSDDQIQEEKEKKEKNYSECINILKEEYAKPDNYLAVEFILMIALKNLDEEMKRLNFNPYWYMDASPTLSARNLRNNLAHGSSAIVEVLETDTKRAVYDTAKMIIEDYELRQSEKIDTLIQASTIEELIATSNISVSLLKQKKELWQNIEDDNLEDTKHLLEHFEDRNYDWRNVPDSTVIHLAAGNKKDDVEMLKLIINKVGLTEEYLRNDVGDTILHTAAQVGNVKILKYIIGTDSIDVIYANNETMTNDNSETPLHVAAIAGQCQSMEVLLNSWLGKYIFSFNENGITAMHSAVVLNQLNIVEVFDSWNYHNSLDSFKVNGDQTFLHLACTHNKPNIVEYLIKQGANGNLVDKEYETAISLGQKYPGLNLESLLGTYITQPFESNAMHRAVMDKSFETFNRVYDEALHLMWTGRCDLLIPLEIAIMNNNKEMVEHIFNKVIADYPAKPYVFKAVLARLCMTTLQISVYPCFKQILNMGLNLLNDYPGDKMIHFWVLKFTGHIMKCWPETYVPLIMERFSVFALDDRMLSSFLDVLKCCNKLTNEHHDLLRDKLIFSLSQSKFINHENTLKLLLWLVECSSEQQKLILAEMHVQQILTSFANCNETERTLTLDILYQLIKNHEEITTRFVECDGLLVYTIKNYTHSNIITSIGILKSINECYTNKELIVSRTNEITYEDIARLINNRNRNKGHLLLFEIRAILVKIWSSMGNSNVLPWSDKRLHELCMN